MVVEVNFQLVPSGRYGCIFIHISDTHPTVMIMLLVMGY